jgi:hypothetical protein
MLDPEAPIYGGLTCNGLHCGATKNSFGNVFTVAGDEGVCFEIHFPVTFHTVTVTDLKKRRDLN